MRVLFVCRGAPGLGRVAPSVSLHRSLQEAMPVESLFMSYLAGHRYLQTLGLAAEDLQSPEGLFIDPMSSGFERCLARVKQFKPDVVVVDGEPYVLPCFHALGLKTVFLANPHDLIGPTNHFREIHRLLTRMADMVVLPSLNWTEDMAEAREGWLVTPAFVRSRTTRPSLRAPLTQPHVVLSLGGGVARAGASFKSMTQRALEALAAVLRTLKAQGLVGTVTVLPGFGFEAEQLQASLDGLRVCWEPLELVDVVEDAELVITRAGRNTIAELLHYGVKGLVLPLSADPLRGQEQNANAQLAQSHEGLSVIWPGDLEHERLLGLVREALVRPKPVGRGWGPPGNERMPALLQSLVEGRLPVRQHVAKGGR